MIDVCEHLVSLLFNNHDGDPLVRLNRAIIKLLCDRLKVVHELLVQKAYSSRLRVGESICGNTSHI